MTPAHDEPGRTEAQPRKTDTIRDGLRYDAFISYSRHNLDVADKIERDLERFPLPRDIRKRLGRRHLNVFRDISDMTGNQLESAIEQKLEDSRTLVVLCSPAARSSKFVGIELTRFAQLRGSAQIVPALVGGEPNDDPGVDPADMAFPEALEEVLGSDPLAVDMRTAWTVRGRRAKLARGSPWVQLVAGIVGATTDDLTARIAKAERHRLQTAVALLAVVLVVVGSLGVFAWQKRGQAIRAAERVAQVQAISRFTSDIGSKPQRNLLLGVQAAGLATEGQGENLLAIDSVRQQLQVAGGLPLLGHPAPTRAASLSSNHRWLATGSDDGTIKLWHLDATDPTGSSASLTGHVGAIHGLSFTPDGRWLVSGGADGTVRLWRITDDGASPGPVLAANRFGAVNAVAISPDGAWLAVGTQDGTTCIWPSTPDGFRERPCDVGRSSGDDAALQPRKQLASDDVHGLMRGDERPCRPVGPEEGFRESGSSATVSRHCPERGLPTGHLVRWRRHPTRGGLRLSRRSLGFDPAQSAAARDRHGQSRRVDQRRCVEPRQSLVGDGQPRGRDPSDGSHSLREPTHRAEGTQRRSARAFIQRRQPLAGKRIRRRHRTVVEHDRPHLPVDSPARSGHAGRPGALRPRLRPASARHRRLTADRRGERATLEYPRSAD